MLFYYTNDNRVYFVLNFAVLHIQLYQWHRLYFEGLGTFNPQDPWTHLILTNFRHGTVFLTHVSVNGSMSSTMTKGASSRVTMLRWLSSGSQSEKDLYLGHTACLRLRVWFSHLPTCIINTRTPVSFPAPLTSRKARPSRWEALEKNPTLSQGAFSATCLNIHISLCAKENGDRRKADYCAAPGPGLSPRLIKYCGGT